MFVHNLGILSISLGIPPHIVSLLLSLIATELPETLNALENLALANISGSMMIQATVPSALGIIFTPWLLDKSLVVAAVITFMSIFIIWMTLKRSCLSVKRLSLNALLYIFFILGMFFIKVKM